MVLVKERADLISSYLVMDPERAKILLVMKPDEACEKINADGNDFTIEEITEYGKNLQAAYEKQQSELDESSLDEVTGGVLCTAAVVGIYAGIAVGSAGLGVAMYKWGW